MRGVLAGLLVAGCVLRAPSVLAVAPVAKPDSATTKSGVAVSIPVMANDSDPDGNTFSIGAFPSAGRPANGTVARKGRFAVYTPRAGFSGTDSFTYRLKDSTNAWSTATKVTVTVRAPSNIAPVARADSASTVSPTPVTVDLLANDSDENGDTLTVVANTTPTGGTVTRSGGIATYTPSEGFSGTATFNYRVSDGKGGAASATVTITVAPKPNTAPVAGADSASTSSPVGVTVDLLANDTDADGDPLSVTAVSDPANGTVSLAGATASYTPAADFSGTDSFSYTLSDGKGGMSSALVTVSVAPPPTPPPVVTAATLNWNIPTTRANGAPLSMAEIAGYEIYVLAESTGQKSVITISDGAVTSYTVSGLAPDTYHFSMAAKDAEGNLSELSSVVSKVIGP